MNIPEARVEKVRCRKEKSRKRSQISLPTRNYYF